MKTMDETISMIIAFVVGIALGIIFFGGLWFTVKKVVVAKLPSLWLLISFILRVSITMLGFYLIADNNWQNLLLCLVGFILARFMVMHFTKALDAKQVQLKKEGSHGA